MSMQWTAYAKASFELVNDRYERPEMTPEGQRKAGHQVARMQVKAEELRVSGSAIRRKCRMLIQEFAHPGRQRLTNGRESSNQLEGRRIPGFADESTA